jgi:hypothetical protein
MCDLIDVFAGFLYMLGSFVAKLVVDRVDIVLFGALRVEAHSYKQAKTWQKLIYRSVARAREIRNALYINEGEQACSGRNDEYTRSRTKY